MKKIILVLALLGMCQVTVAQKKKKAVAKTTTTVRAAEPEVRTSSSSSSSSSRSSSNSSGQEGFRSGDIFVSGSFGYTSTKEAGVSVSKTAILPSLGYFIKDNIALVGTIGFENSSSGGASSNAFVIGAAARYYMTPASKFSLFGQGGIGFKSESAGSGGGSATQFSLGVKPGLNYFLNNHFSLEATMGEVGIVNSSAGGASNTDFNFGFDFASIGLGLNYKF